MPSVSVRGSVGVQLVLFVNFPKYSRTSVSEPSFGPAAGGPGRTGPSNMTVLISGTGPATTKPGPDRADRPTGTGGEVCDVRGCSGEVGHMRERRRQGVRWAARLLLMNCER
ncbi:hypothetical protein VPH35_115337 [Triticum aestivum]